MQLKEVPATAWNPVPGTCCILADDLASHGLLQRFSAAISYATLQHCDISQAASALVHGSCCR